MATKINKKLERHLTVIAKRHSYMVEERGDLKTRNNDRDDFLDVSV